MLKQQCTRTVLCHGPDCRALRRTLHVPTVRRVVARSVLRYRTLAGVTIDGKLHNCGRRVPERRRRLAAPPVVSKTAGPDHHDRVRTCRSRPAWHRPPGNSSPPRLLAVDITTRCRTSVSCGRFCGSAPAEPTGREGLDRHGLSSRRGRVWLGAHGRPPRHGARSVAAPRRRGECPAGRLMWSASNATCTTRRASAPGCRRRLGGGGARPPRGHGDAGAECWSESSAEGPSGNGTIRQRTRDALHALAAKLSPPCSDNKYRSVTPVINRRPRRLLPNPIASRNQLSPLASEVLTVSPGNSRPLLCGYPLSSPDSDSACSRVSRARALSLVRP